MQTQVSCKDDYYTCSYSQSLLPRTYWRGQYWKQLGCTDRGL